MESTHEEKLNITNFTIYCSGFLYRIAAAFTDSFLYKDYVEDIMEYMTGLFPELRISLAYGQIANVVEPY